MELLSNAWTGWQEFMDAGKFAALLAASLIFLLVFYGKTTRKTLLIYAAITAVCCIVPPTAAVLMLYQTKFYDYQWVWSLVPMTTVIAYGAVCALGDCWPDFKLSEWKKGVPVLVLLLVVLLLSSGLGTNVTEGEETQKRAASERVLEQVQAEVNGQKICLWAPADILEYVRETDASVELLYGRNMWDQWLNAYSYDTYPEEMVSLYQWMEEAALAGTGAEDSIADMREVSTKVDTALKAGANCILLPEILEEDAVKAMEKSLHVRTLRVDGYYLLIG